MKLWLTGATRMKKVQGVRAIREVAKDSGTVQHASLTGARRAWEQAANGQTILLANLPDELGRAAKITKLLDNGGVFYQLTGDEEHPNASAPEPFDNATEADTPDPAPTEPDEDDTASYEATQAACILIALNGGNATNALVSVRAIGRVAPDVEFWSNVAEYLLDTFPSDQAR